MSRAGKTQALEIAQSTPTAAAIARLVEGAYGLGPVVHAEFLRRSFNQVYGLRFASGRRAVARLSADRPRGRPNLEFEAALLEHLHARDVHVSRCLRTRDGAISLPVALPEGTRPLALFEHLDGLFTGDAPEEAEVFGRELAHLHVAAASYGGPESRYRFDVAQLIDRPLQGVLEAPTMTDGLRPAYRAVAVKLRERILAIDGLSQVICHGDAHGANNFITRDAHGQMRASFFDFDDAAPGYLAFELAVYPWSQHPRSAEAEFSQKALARWRSQLAGYAQVRPIAAADLQAIPLFMAARQLWLFGEYAGRVDTWGSQTMTTGYLERQLKLFEKWETLALP